MRGREELLRAREEIRKLRERNEGLIDYLLKAGGKTNIIETLIVSAGTDSATSPREREPTKLTFQREFHIAYWTDPKDGERKQVWIPVIWLEHEDGSRKAMEIEGLIDKQNMTLLPLEHLSFKE